ncbi:NAD-dependent epimerase/dehydratase family protein, partial [Candidatus Pelagibacter sp.]|nr:NAD-dependent epimerase/dehydratase family protein [Candidatus Pelagibacter sp.]
SMKKKILVTGCAGFVGSFLTKKLCLKYEVMGIDNLNNYYDVKLKKERLTSLKKLKNFKFKKVCLTNFRLLNNLIKSYKPNIVIHLAAQAGVRFSLLKPDEYFSSNIKGFYNLLKCIKLCGVKKVLYASSSSVYGDSKKFPLKENMKTDNPQSLYASSKKINEILASTWSHLYNIQMIGLRFFSIYGPKGRPDMAYYLFSKKIFNKEKIKLFNYGKNYRDYTYIEDVVDSIYELMNVKLKNKHEVFNIGNNTPISTIKLLKLLESNYKKKSIKKKIQQNKMEVLKTYASTVKLQKFLNKKTQFTKFEKGLKIFTDWYLKFQKN